MKRTSRGRVVYDRPVHFYSAKDVRRILRNMVWTQYTPAEALGEVDAIVQELLDILGGIGSGGLAQTDAEIQKALDGLFASLAGIVAWVANQIGTSIKKLFGF